MQAYILHDLYQPASPLETSGGSKLSGHTLHTPLQPLSAQLSCPPCTAGNRSRRRPGSHEGNAREPSFSTPTHTCM